MLVPDCKNFHAPDSDFSGQHSAELDGHLAQVVASERNADQKNLIGYTYCNGEFIEGTRATLSLNDRGFLYGDGIYTTVKVDRGIPLFLDEHLRRLTLHCAQLRIAPPALSPLLFQELIALHPPEPILRLRIVITGGEGTPLDLSLRPGHLLATVTPHRESPPTTLRMTQTFSLELVHAPYKTLANFNRLWVLDTAKQRGYDDGISLSSQGFLLEASFGNLFWIDGDTLYTPARTLPYYFGVTLATFLHISEWNISFVEHTLADIPESASLFRTSTLGGIVPITQIDNRLFHGQQAPHVQRLWQQLCESLA